MTCNRRTADEVGGLARLLGHRGEKRSPQRARRHRHRWRTRRQRAVADQRLEHRPTCSSESSCTPLEERHRGSRRSPGAAAARRSGPCRRPLCQPNEPTRRRWPAGLQASRMARSIPCNRRHRQQPGHAAGDPDHVLAQQQLARVVDVGPSGTAPGGLGAKPRARRHVVEVLDLIGAVAHRGRQEAHRGAPRLAPARLDGVVGGGPPPSAAGARAPGGPRWPGWSVRLLSCLQSIDPGAALDRRAPSWHHGRAEQPGAAASP